MFSAFHKAQFILLIILIVSGLIASLFPGSWLVVGLIALMLVLQSVWIFPILSSRVDATMTGAKISKSHVHILYGILEVAKLTLLVYLSLRVSLENL